MLLLIGTQRLTSHTQDLHELESDKKKNPSTEQRKGAQSPTSSQNAIFFSGMTVGI